MARAPFLHLTLSAVGLLACKPQAAEPIYTAYPKMTLGQEQLEFGEFDGRTPIERTVVLSNEGGMPMGVGSKDEDTEGNAYTGVDVMLDMDGNFTVDFDTDDIQCPETEEEEAKRRAKGRDSVDTGDGETGSSDDTADEDDDDDDDDDDTEGAALFVLDPGCRIPLTVTFVPTDVGEIWGALRVESVQAEQTEEAKEANELPEYLRDPISYQQVVYLHGSASYGQGTVVVTPRSYDFGYVYYEDTDEHLTRVDITNVGTSEIVLGSAALSETCDEAFSIVHSFADGTILAEEESTLVEVAFDPTDDDAAYCQLLITSDDIANPEIDVTLKGNAGADPNNSPPTAYIRSPEPGYSYNAVKPLELELNIFDKNQPATSLTCKVKSALSGAALATCTAPDESGHVFVEIPRDDLEIGIDTLIVTVTDAAETSTTATVSVLVSTAYPDSDDDGDGYGVESEVPDCDDGNRDTYPEAAEVYDGEDNDCDGVLDEGTDGYDDDGDGVTEVAGDCNDYNSGAYPGAAERGDSVDNDCDGRVDEGTQLYDDDGDGFAEVNNDCDDADAEVSPSASEICDGVDNDCDGLKDSGDGCVETDSSPLIIGEIRAESNACESGEPIALSVLAFDADGQTSTYQWGSDDESGPNAFDNYTARVVNWTCPELPAESGGKLVSVFVQAFDPDANADWAVTKIAVYPADYGLYDDHLEYAAAVEEEGTCATGGSGATASLVAAGLALAARRRRR